MISVDFEYHRAHTISEAVELFERLKSEGKEPLIFNGGTEIITMMRIHALYTGARSVIDIKTIPECTFTGFQDNQFVIGSAISLAQLEEMSEFPLLGKVCSRIADHTSREKITLGGNICGNIQYKEAILPLLLTECTLVIANKSGTNKVPILKIFDRQVKLDPGSFIVQILVDKNFLKLPFISKKMTRIDRIGYPLLTVSALRTGEQTRFAFSGLCGFPFRSHDIEEALNDQTLSVKKRISTAIGLLPAKIVNDLEGSSAYREFVLRNVLEEAIVELGGSEKNETNN